MLLKINIFVCGLLIGLSSFMPKAMALQGIATRVYSCAAQDRIQESNLLKDTAANVEFKDANGLVLSANLRLFSVQFPGHNYQESGSNLKIAENSATLYASSANYEVWVHKGQVFRDSSVSEDLPHSFQLKLPNGDVVSGGCSEL